MKNLLEPSITEILNLNGKTILVTGGAEGIGRFICYRLAEMGANIAIIDLNYDKAKETAMRIINNGGKALLIESDVKIISQIDKVIQKVIDKFGTINILINNAAIYNITPLFDVDELLWKNTLGVNLKAAFFYSQAVAKKMIERKHGGKIINIASMASYRPSKYSVHYDTSKGGITMLTKSLALSLAPFNITVNAIAPGGISTSLSENVFFSLKKLLKSQNISVDQLKKNFIKQVPLGRFGKPDDIARVVVFLASDLSEYITGTTIIVDGGFLIS